MFALFLIMYPLSKSFTVTLNSTVLVSPAGTVTSIPFVVKSSKVFPKSASFILMLPSTNVVPSGMLSFTTNVIGAVPSASPLFVAVIV